MRDILAADLSRRSLNFELGDCRVSQWQLGAYKGAFWDNLLCEEAVGAKCNYLTIRVSSEDLKDDKKNLCVLQMDSLMRGLVQAIRICIAIHRSRGLSTCY
jgi:hypothetical protein